MRLVGGTPLTLKNMVIQSTTSDTLQNFASCTRKITSKVRPTYNLWTHYYLVEGKRIGDTRLGMQKPLARAEDPVDRIAG